MSQELKSDAERGEWFITITGRRVYALDPRPDDIDLLDIAHALANLCRFGGHCSPFYSVAQHSVHVSELVEDDALRLPGLMHDATEAYLGDVIRPLKLALSEYQTIEEIWWLAIARRFDLPWELPPAIKTADRRALATERRDVASNSRWNIDSTLRSDERGYAPDPKPITALSNDAARQLFMARYIELSGGKIYP